MFYQIILISRHFLSNLFSVILFLNVLLSTINTINDANNHSTINKYECRITKHLYKMFVGKPWHGTEESPKIYCSRPGKLFYSLFFILFFLKVVFTFKNKGILVGYFLVFLMKKMKIKKFW